MNAVAIEFRLHGCMNTNQTKKNQSDEKPLGIKNITSTNADPHTGADSNMHTIGN